MNNYEVLERSFDVEAAIAQTAEQGYFFGASAITTATCRALCQEAERLALRPTTNDAPLNAGTSYEVTQSHERAYLAVDDQRIPVASMVNRALVDRMQALSSIYPELSTWQPTEAGLQRYRDSDDGISPHRDSKTDQLLGATITVDGSSVVRAYRALGEPDDYTNIHLVEEFKTTPGSLMLLRAPGFAGGERTIHEARPPESNSRLVLNLRMRSDQVRSPKQQG